MKVCLAYIVFIHLIRSLDTRELHSCLFLFCVLFNKPSSKSTKVEYLVCLKAVLFLLDVVKYTKFYLSSGEVGSYAKFSLGNKGTRVSQPDVSNFIIGNKLPLANIDDGSDVVDGINSSFVDLGMSCKPIEVVIDSLKVCPVSLVIGLKSSVLGKIKDVDAEICPLFEYSDNSNENNCSIENDPKFPFIQTQSGIIDESEDGSQIGYLNGMLNTAINELIILVVASIYEHYSLNIRVC